MRSVSSSSRWFDVSDRFRFYIRVALLAALAFFALALYVGSPDPPSVDPAAPSSAIAVASQTSDVGR